MHEKKDIQDLIVDIDSGQIDWRLIAALVEEQSYSIFKSCEGLGFRELVPVFQGREQLVEYLTKMNDRHG